VVVSQASAQELVLASALELGLPELNFLFATMQGQDRKKRQEFLVAASSSLVYLFPYQ
jgi:hypothetical protein